MYIRYCELHPPRMDIRRKSNIQMYNLDHIPVKTIKHRKRYRRKNGLCIDFKTEAIKEQIRLYKRKIEHNKEKVQL